MPLWILAQYRDNQGGQTPFDEINEEVRDAFFSARDELEKNKPVALLVDSPGGQANCAYQIATFLRKHCGSFVAVVPRSAKSAATLLTLGGSMIILGRNAELGPLDAQLMDLERESYSSALDEVQSLERLHAFALDALDRSMMLLAPRTGKKVETILPLVMRFITDMTTPLVEKIDTVYYTQMSRILKVAEAYAIRLLKHYYPAATAEKIARSLVEQYPEHGFVIDAEELNDTGIKNKEVSDEQAAIMEKLLPHLRRGPIIGGLKENSNEEK